MGVTIEWETELEKALSRAKDEDKCTVVDFFNPG
jgi:hypothetical protein